MVVESLSLNDFTVTIGVDAVRKYILKEGTVKAETISLNCCTYLAIIVDKKSSYLKIPFSDYRKRDLRAYHD